MNHEHNWVDVPVSLKGEVFGMEYQVSIKHCTICNLYDHTISLAGYSYEYFAMTAAPGVEGIIQNLAIKLYCSIFGENATATKFTPGGGSTSGGGVGRPKGYADDNGTPAITANGELLVTANCVNINSLGESASYATKALELNPEHISVNSDSVSSDSWPNYSMYLCYEFTAPVDGTYSYYGPAGEYLYTLNIAAGSTWRTFHNETRAIKLGRDVLTSTLNTKAAFVKGEKVNVCAQIYGENSYWSTYMYARAVRATVNPIFVKVVPLESGRKADITINNNTWNGNIYTDNSTNLTYIYPQYTTVNEKNETVTNISNTPIIYNNETKQYYTYDQTTKNYYYITYNAQPTPSPSPSPAPTEKPGGSISTPETSKPGGDAGDTTGILAVLVEIRDNMIQGFLDIKAAFVAGFADFSANFQLAIDNLNINIQNFFNKKMEDLPEPTPTPSPTPEPSNPTPSPSPSPAPTDPPSPSPTPDPSKPDSGDKTNNFWTIIFPNGGGSEDGKKGIFWALVSLILALIAFFANLAVGVGYLFPFLPDGVVMTINTCLIVIFLFTIIKFIMRSK